MKAAKEEDDIRKDEWDELKKQLSTQEKVSSDMLENINRNHQDIITRFTQDLKDLNGLIEEGKKGKDGYSWEKKVKDARDERPKEWKDNEKTYPFEVFAKGIRRWGGILSDHFDEMLDRVEKSALGNEWEDQDFHDIELEEGEWQRMSKELYKVLESQVKEDATAKQYVKAVADKEGFTAWRSLIGRFDSRRTMDETIEWHK